MLDIEPSAAYGAPEDGRRKVLLDEENGAVAAAGVELSSRRAPAEIPVID